MSGTDAADGEDGYYLGRKDVESRRLNSQHDIMKRAFGYHVYPTIMEKLGPDSRIADVATGTGVWLDDLSSKLAPSCELHGFDLSPAQYPPDGQLASNIKLHIQDAKQPFAAEWHGKFDLVHVRFLIVAMRDDDWEAVARNIYQLLKPGGAVMWVEPDWNNLFSVMRGPDTNVLPVALTELQRGMLDVSGISQLKVNGATSLAKIYAQVGYTGIIDDIVSSDNIAEQRYDWAMNIYNLMVAALKTCHELKLPSAWSLEKISEVSRKALAEVDAGCYGRGDLHYVIGFKP